jgi:hypothetical protein
MVLCTRCTRDTLKSTGGNCPVCRQHVNEKFEPFMM